MFRFDPVEYLCSKSAKSCPRQASLASTKTFKESAPANDGLFRIDTLRKIEHCAMIVHIDGDLLAGLRMQDCERGTHRDGVIAFASCAEERANNAFLRVGAAEVVI